MQSTMTCVAEVPGAQQTLAMTESVENAIRRFIGEHPAERGGMLGCDPDGTIRHFVPDTTGRATSGAYDPDIEKMNEIIKQWKANGIQFAGFVHSHPRGVRSLSSYDIWYAGEILAAFTKLEILHLPLVMTIPDTGAFEIIPYAAISSEDDRKKVAVVKTHLKIVERNPVLTLTDTRETAPQPESGIGRDDELRAEDDFTRSIHLKKEARTYRGHFPSIWASATTTEHESEAQEAAEKQRDRFVTRLSGDYDITLLDRTRLVVIGTGGVSALIRNAARTGYGEFVLIDPDTITDPNIASQQASPDAIGQYKAEQLAVDVTSINPAAAVVAVKAPVEDIDDAEFEHFFTHPLRGIRTNGSMRKVSASYGVPLRTVSPRPPKQTILLVMTDNFAAQARGHRLGLNVGLPTICAQEYAEGRGAEITYTIPGITPACHRCITSSRYQAYLKDQYQNDVTSQGAPIFAAEFLNASLGHILLAVTYHGSNHPRWGNMITRLGNRNLVRLRMDPDYDTHFGDAFRRRHTGAVGFDSMFMLDSLFLPQTPDCGQSERRPVCPDCGGSGDLRLAIGTIPDTRIMR